MVLVIAHRGGCYGPENTISNFEKTLERGIYALELDLRLTLDEEIIVFHDPFLGSKTDGSGYVRDKTLEEIKNLKVKEGRRSDEIPLFQEVLDSVGGYEPLLKLHLKDEIEQGRIIHMLRDYPREKLIVHVGSKMDIDRSYLDHFKREGMKTSYGAENRVEGKKSRLERGLELGVDIISFTWPFVDGNLRAETRKNNIEMDIFIPRDLELDEEMVREIYGIGPDYVTVKDPVKFKNMYERVEKKLKK